ncbi:tetraacyldisaccharide 4'-kinase [Flagellimonas algicola]|uniref:Tetraacyldisaccharide 4'-kinase n=1 Tax=Flagellimonas algicola TaxID=2583815 RepID=A0ABY2WG77_9FLAO|nr:tetraacyldisaccharide 4'-kinase [Allomuricauda algicola]TMU50542.1 tetraacyldisaccharide 4'-kinase [Allomuricauda algicola]
MLQFLRKIAFPFSLIYALIVHVRNYLFDWGVFKSISYETPTICVGNLSVGGTGKTPMIEYLIRILSNHKIAVLSRGYKRKSKGFLLANPSSTVADLGDEPFQIHQKFPNIYVAVDADRRNGIAQLEKMVQPDVILLDDAFQHRKVKPKFSILLTAYGQLYPKGWYLPTGNLRDAKREARRADVIVVTKCPKILPKTEKDTITSLIQPKPHQQLLFSHLSYAEKLKDGKGNKVAPSKLGDKKIALVTGIASPEPLVQYLRDIGIDFQHLAFGDHHNFSSDEIEKFKHYDAVLTTEKDFVRLYGRVEPLYYLEIAHDFNLEDENLLKEVVESQF